MDGWGAHQPPQPSAPGGWGVGPSSRREGGREGGSPAPARPRGPRPRPPPPGGATGNALRFLAMLKSVSPFRTVYGRRADIRGPARTAPAPVPRPRGAPAPAMPARLGLRGDLCLSQQAGESVRFGGWLLPVVVEKATRVHPALHRRRHRRTRKSRPLREPRGGMGQTGTAETACGPPRREVVEGTHSTDRTSCATARADLHHKDFAFTFPAVL